MSTTLVKERVARFLKSPEPEVLCVKGKWGVGKTHMWKVALAAAAATPDGIALDRSAYVSLFGVNTLEELKFAIFENTIKRDQISSGASLDTLKSAVEGAEGLGRKHAWLLNLFPFTRNALAGAAPGLFLTVRNQILCIDDYERKGQKLDAGDVLGLASFLKEERRCKVILLMNDEALTPEQRKKFDEYLEKVVDTLVTFNPSAKESVAIALPDGDDITKIVAANCTALGIASIRVIRKIATAVSDVAPLLKEYDAGVMRQATMSLPLFVWGRYQPGEAPPVEFLKTKAKGLYGLKKTEDATPEQAAWNALLAAYGFIWADDFDGALIEGVQNGYFDPEKIHKFAKDVQAQAIASKADSSFGKAWEMYHDSFDQNQDDVLNAIHTAFMSGFQHISPLNLNGTVTLFKVLGRADQAKEMIAAYVNGRMEGRQFFDLNEYPFSGEVTDPDIIETFNNKLATFVDDRDLAKMLLGIRDGGWDEEVLRSLTSIPVSEYIRVLKSHKGRDLRKIIEAGLQFNRISNATESMREVARRMIEALTMVGKESSINARRVGKFGIKIEPTE